MREGCEQRPHAPCRLQGELGESLQVMCLSERAFDSNSLGVQRSWLEMNERESVEGGIEDQKELGPGQHPQTNMKEKRTRSSSTATVDDPPKKEPQSLAQIR